MRSGKDIPFKVSILGHSKECTESKQEKKKVTVYQISVSSPINNWKVKHRYNDFFNLHELLLQNYSNLPVLPQKTFFSVSSESKIEKRRKELERYLTELLDLDLIMQNVYVGQFFNMKEFFPEFLCRTPEVLCKYETAPSLVFTDVNFLDDRTINYVLCSKGITKPHSVAKQLVEVKPVGVTDTNVHKSLLNGFKFDEHEPVGLFQDKRIVKTFDLKAHCLEYFAEAAILAVGFSHGIVAVYKEEKRSKLDDEYALTNIAKFRASKERVTKILINTLRGEMLVLGKKNKVNIVDMAMWTVKSTVKIGTHPILNMVMDEVYNMALTTNDVGEMLVVDLAQEKPIIMQTIEVEKGKALSCMDADIDSGKIVVAVEQTGEIKLIDIEFPFTPVD